MQVCKRFHSYFYTGAINCRLHNDFKGRSLKMGVLVGGGGGGGGGGS